MRSITALKSLFISAAVLAIAGCTSRPPIHPASSATVSIYDRVISTGVIRCGYVTYPPGFITSPNGNAPSGIFADLMETAAHNLNLRIEWTKETGWASMIEDLNTDKFDMVCSPVWANSTRARLADFGTPIYYSAIGVYVRRGDTRFNDNLAAINMPTITIATIDGEMSSIIAASDFPKARVVSLPQMADDSQLLLNVATGHADVAFVEPAVAESYSAQNAGSVYNAAAAHPIRYFPTSVMFRKRQPEFASMIDVALEEQLNSGAVDKLFVKYNVPKGAFLLPALPYRPAR